MYLTYMEFLEYGGELDEPTFNRTLFKAQKTLDRWTANRISKMKVVPVAVKMCLMELIRQESVYEKNISSLSSAGSDGRMISSFSTDGYQESYVGSGNSSPAAYLNEMRKETNKLEENTIKDYLAYEYDDRGTKLLYRGVYNEAM